MFRWILAILVWLCAGAQVYAAQKGCVHTVRLQVVETHNLESLIAVTVHIDELGKEAITDADGFCEFTNVCSGEVTVHYYAEGYENRIEHIQVLGDTTVKLKLAHLAQTLNAVQVTAARTATPMQSKEQMKQADIAANSGKSLGDMLQAVNGVTVLSNGSTVAKPVIHGLHSNRIVMLNNGIRQEDQQWGNEHAPNIDPFLASNITVLKGAAGVRYGTDAVAGVVIVEPAPLRHEPGSGGEANLVAFSNNRMGVGSAMVEHAFESVPGLAFRVQGTFKKGGNYRIPGYYVANTGVEEKNYSATIGLHRAHYSTEVFYSHFDTDLGLYRGSHTGSQKDLNAAIGSDTPLVSAGFTYNIDRPMQHVTHDLLKAKLNADSKAGLLSLTYAYQHNFRQEYDVLRVENGKAQLNLTLNTHSLNLNLDHKALGPIKGQIGADATYQENFFQPGDRLFIPNYSSWSAAGYVIERYRKNNTTLEGGIRYDYRTYDVFNPEGTNQAVVEYNFDYSSISGTLGLQQQLTHNWNIGVTLANAWRAPQASELFSGGFHQGAARIELGNKNLQPERSYNLNLESEYRLNNKLSVDADLYAQYIKDYIYLEPGADVLTIRGYFKSFNYKQTDAFLKGADLSVKYNWNDNLETGLKASSVLARNITQKDWLILMPSDRIAANIKYTRTISKHLQDCFAGIDVKYVFQQKRIPSNFDQIDYPRPPAAYFLADVSVGTTLYAGKQPLYLSLTTMNILNAKYRDYMDVFRYFINEPGTNIVLRVRVPFNLNQKS